MRWPEARDGQRARDERMGPREWRAIEKEIASSLGTLRGKGWLAHRAENGLDALRDIGSRWEVGGCVGLRHEMGTEPEMSMWGQGSGERSQKAVER